MSAEERPEIRWLEFRQRKPETPERRDAVRTDLGRPETNFRKLCCHTARPGNARAGDDQRSFRQHESGTPSYQRIVTKFQGFLTLVIHA